MAMVSSPLRLIFLFLVAGAATSTAVTPVQKVIELMNGMIAKGTEEMNSEQLMFATYNTWCTDTIDEKKRAIAKGNRNIERFQADVAKYSSDAETFGAEIAELEDTIADIVGNTKAAMKVRDMEHADFLAAQTDYQSSVDALSKGIDTLKAKSGSVAQASLMQTAKKLLASPVIDEKARRVIGAYLDEDPEDRDAVAIANGPARTVMLQQNPQANAFEFQSNAIIQMFDEMKEKFEGKVADSEKHETEDEHEYLMLKQDLEHQKQSAELARDQKAEQKAKALQDAADSKGSLADTTSTRDADTKYSLDTEATCATKDADFADRQKLRKEELEVLGKAIEILGGVPTEEAKKHLPALLQGKNHGATTKSFVQLRARSQNPNQIRVAAFLQDMGKRFNSKVLAMIALRVAADPFKTVKKMVKDMIVKLMEEATEEAEHKGFCDKELTTNEHTRKAKTEAAEILTAELDELSASLAITVKDIADLSEAVSALDKAVAEATTLRAEEKEKNKLTIADSQKAQEAVEKAMGVLDAFYSKAADATALVQASGKKEGQPEIFDSSYTGMGSASGGVMGMIEVIQSDFARLETETQAQEDQAQKEYEEFLNDSEVDKTSKKKDIEHKTAKKQDEDQAITTKKADLAGTEKELTSALAYFEKLKPTCIETGDTYDDKVARRKEEIESLQEALKILNGEDLAAFVEK